MLNKGDFLINGSNMKDEMNNINNNNWNNESNPYEEYMQWGF